MASAKQEEEDGNRERMRGGFRGGMGWVFKLNIEGPEAPGSAGSRLDWAGRREGEERPGFFHFGDSH